MNVLLWILQVLLSLHTITGAIWKFSNSEEAVPSLSMIPHQAWIAFSGLEILCAIGLIIPIFVPRFRYLVPVSAGVIAAEMFLYCALHLFSGDPSFAPMIYWLVVAAICIFIAAARLKLNRAQS